MKTLVQLGQRISTAIGKRRPKLYELGGATAGGAACYRAWGLTGLLTFGAVALLLKSAEDDA